MNRIIRYGVCKDDGTVISKVGREYAVVTLQFSDIGKDGDFHPKESDWKLEKYEYPINHKEYRWTKKIPVELKNRHREFWGMKPLKVKEQNVDE